MTRDLMGAALGGAPENYELNEVISSETEMHKKLHFHLLSPANHAIALMLEFHRRNFPTLSLYTFIHRLSTPFAYSTISSPPNLLSPYSLSTKLIGTSATVHPIAFALTIISI